MNKELKHYGILGMRWGRRKGGSTSSADHSTAKGLKKKRLSELSNDELKKLTTRMQLEKQYKDLKSASSPTSAAKKFIANLLVESGKEEAKRYISKALGKGAEELIKKFPKK